METCQVNINEDKSRFTSLRPSSFDSSFDSNHGEKLLSLAIRGEQQARFTSTK